MKLKVQLVVYTDDAHAEQVQEVAVLEKDYQRIEHLDLTLSVTTTASSSSAKDSEIPIGNRQKRSLLPWLNKPGFSLRTPWSVLNLECSNDSLAENLVKQATSLYDALPRVS